MDATTIAVHVNPLAPPPLATSPALQPLVETQKHACHQRQRDDNSFLDSVVAAILFNLPLSPELTSAIEMRLVTQSAGSTAALRRLRSVMGQAFETGNHEHEALLEEVWDLVTDGAIREGGRLTKEWGRLGFQGKDPASDFRGAGMLGLGALHHIATEFNHTAKAICDEVDAVAPNGFPLALAVISVTDALMRLLEAHPLTSNAVFGACVDEEDALGTFYELFGKVFTAFARHHRDAIQAFVSQGGVPQMAVMQYNSIHRGFFEGLGRGTLVRMVPCA